MFLNLFWLQAIVRKGIRILWRMHEITIDE